MADYNKVLNFWFPNDDYNSWWFKSTKELDQHIYDNYFEIMISVFDNFNIEDYEGAIPEKIIHDIILLDQFSRNINRIFKIEIHDYTVKAVQLSNLWITNKYCFTCPIKWTVFALLPIRHINDYEKMSELMDLFVMMENYNDTIIKNIIYQKFKLHSKRQFDCHQPELHL
jgi:uncharacterized protein (DUF924 family)